MSTEKKTQELDSPEKTAVTSAEKERKKAPTKPAAKKRPLRRKKPKQPSYNHIPIIIFLLVIFSFTLFCIGIGLTRYLGPNEAGIPACGRTPCPLPFTELANPAAQKGGGE